MATRQAAPVKRTGGAPTHFLSIPLLRRQLARSIAAFRDDVTNINSASPLPPSAIRPPGTMHITLGVMHLPQPAQLARAVALLQSLRLRDLIADAHTTLRTHGGRAVGDDAPSAKRSAWLTLRGLRAMHDPARAGVLYAPPGDVAGQEAGLVYAVSKAVRQRFIDAGVMEAEERPFVLHATVVNTVHVKRERGKKGGERLMVDARGMMEEYAEYVWLDRHEMRSVAICKMGAKAKGDGDEAYEVVEEVMI